MERIAATEARAGQIVQGKGIDYREKTFNHGDHNEHKEDDAGRRNEQVGCVVKTHWDAELTFKIFEACADFLTPDGLGSCR
ncbi:MAG: hypothetical protein WB773_18960, partial [Isosphaeraceae bacterium]